MASSPGNEGTYHGYDEDIKILNEPYVWVLSLGIIPALAAISLPIDLAVDTLLYPIDKANSINSQKQYALKDTVPVYSLNLTGQQDFQYTVTVDNKKKPLITSSALTKPADNQSIVRVNLTALFPHRYNTAEFDTNQLTFTKQNKVSKTNNDIFSGNTTNIVKTASPGQLRSQTRSVIIVFLPCDEVTVIGSTKPNVDITALQRSVIQADYLKLKQLAEHSKCPPITPDMIVNLI